MKNEEDIQKNSSGIRQLKNDKKKERWISWSVIRSKDDTYREKNWK